MNYNILIEQLLPNTTYNDGALEFDSLEHANEIHILIHYFYDSNPEMVSCYDWSLKDKRACLGIGSMHWTYWTLRLNIYEHQSWLNARARNAVA